MCLGYGSPWNAQRCGYEQRDSRDRQGGIERIRLVLPRAVVEPAWREGRVALHTLPAAEAKVTTVLVRRRDAYVSSALNAFLHAVRGDHPLARAAA